MTAGRFRRLDAEGRPHGPWFPVSNVTIDATPSFYERDVRFLRAEHVGREMHLSVVRVSPLFASLLGLRVPVPAKAAHRRRYQRRRGR